MTCKTLYLIGQALKDNTTCSLVEFNLGKNNFKDRGGTKLGESLRYNSTIVKMNLSDNNLTDESALAINRNLMNTKKITEINLSKNLINLRVIEMVKTTLAKIHEFKIAS